ncbi:unnamed protein product [Pleuronectes platessa]|uniref:Uncharacterized protein n=1 Tax=Pleuronectes platessa TaxID=8262 RepID=A0A9N7UTV9_PLEPL|nr:unnamed protein product [Pleuronectes platessa]
MMGRRLRLAQLRHTGPVVEEGLCALPGAVPPGTLLTSVPARAPARSPSCPVRLGRLQRQAALRSGSGCETPVEPVSWCRISISSQRTVGAWWLSAAGIKAGVGAALLTSGSRHLTHTYRLLKADTVSPSLLPAAAHFLHRGILGKDSDDGRAKRQRVIMVPAPTSAAHYRALKSCYQPLCHYPALIHRNPIRTHQNPSKPLRTRENPSAAPIRTPSTTIKNTKPSEPIKTTQNPGEPIRAHQNPPKPIRTQENPSEPNRLESRTLTTPSSSIVDPEQRPEPSGPGPQPEPRSTLWFHPENSSSIVNVLFTCRLDVNSDSWSKEPPAASRDL